MSSNAAPMLMLGLFGLGVTAGAIAGIVALGRKYPSGSSGTRVAIVVGMIGLLGFALLGLAAAGCGVILSNARF